MKWDQMEILIEMTADWRFVNFSDDADMIWEKG